MYIYCTYIHIHIHIHIHVYIYTYIYIYIYCTYIIYIYIHIQNIYTYIGYINSTSHVPQHLHDFFRRLGVLRNVQHVTRTIYSKSGRAQWREITSQGHWQWENLGKTTRKKGICSLSHRYSESFFNMIWVNCNDLNQWPHHRWWLVRWIIPWKIAELFRLVNISY